MVSCRFAEHSRQKEHAVSFSVCRFSVSHIHGVVCWLLFVSMVLSIDEQRERNRMVVRRHRSHETDDARKERQKRDRERHQRVCSAASTDEESHEPARESRHGWLDREIPRLQPVSRDTKNSVLHELRLKLGPSGLDEATCAVCDCN